MKNQCTRWVTARKVAVLALAVSSFLSPAVGVLAAEEVRVWIELPDRPLMAGETIEVPVYVEDGDLDLASYALRVRYSSEVLRIVEIEGGAFAGFSRRPVTDPESFASGRTDFTANNRELLATPRSFEIARIRIDVLRSEAREAFVGIRLAPRGGLVDGEHFELVPATLQGGGRLLVEQR